MKNQLFVFIGFLISLNLFAQDNTGNIAGIITDKEFNDEPLAFANVILVGENKGTTTDMDGLYNLANLQPGTYIVEFSYVGYKTITIPDVVVEAGKVTEINAAMSATAAALDEVTITTVARRDSEVALLLDQKDAVNIKQSIGAEELTRKGVGDAAAAVSKISGISKQQGSGNVFVRGLGDRYQNTTLNGLSLPSTDVNKKNIDLDLFSTDIISSIAVSKAFNPNFYGDFGAGNVDITSKSHSGKAFVNINMGSGVNSNAIGESDRFVRSEGTSHFGYYNRYDNNPFAVVLAHPVDPESAGSPINTNIGIEGGFKKDINDESYISFFGAASFANGFEYRNGVARDFTNVLKVDFPSVEEFEYSTTTTALANIDYRINSDNVIRYRSLYVNSSKDEVGYYGINGEGFNRDANQSEDGYYVMNVLFNQDQLFVNQLLGEHKNETLEVNWGFGYNHVMADEPDRKRITLQDYQFALDNDPATHPAFFYNIPFDNQRFFQDINDNEINGFLNVSKTFSENIKLNFGYNGRSKQRNFSSIRYGYELFNNRAEENLVTDVNNIDALLNINNLNIPAGEGFYNTVVLNPISPEIGSTNRPGLPDSVYEGILNINAGFASAEITLDKFLFVPGVRVENFSQSIEYDVLNDDIQPGINTTIENSETVFLPSLSTRYKLNEDMNLRASFSQTISLPEFKEIAPFVYEDVTVRYGGNPDLLGSSNPDFKNISDKSYSDIYNFDLKYEWFFGSGEIISAALFYKQINDPVNRVVAADATGDQRYFRTGKKAEVLGFEIEARKNLFKDSDDRDVLNLGLNVAYLDTNQDLYDEVSGAFTTSFNRSEDNLEGASDLIFNADLTYSPRFGNYEPQATLVGSYFSDRIFALGSGDLGNIVEKSVTSLDFVLKNPITDNFEINFSLTNILNPDITFVRENTGFGDIVISEFKAGVNVGIGLKYKF
jgi:TonB-dependent receptor